MGRRGWPLGPLWARLALVFVALVVGALVLLSGLVLVSARRDVSELARDEQDETVADIAEATADAYAEADGWGASDLSAADALADAAGAGLVVVDSTGRRVAGSPGEFPDARVRRAPVAVSGERVGAVEVGFATTGLPSAERHLRDALVAQVAAGAGLAALLALVVAIAISRRITRPVAALIGTARALESGNLAARAGVAGAPGELGELAVAFDRMADALAREDTLRRALVADIAHELRTPLTILRASFEAVADGVVDLTPDGLSSMHDDVLRLVRIVDDLEALSAADAAGLALEVHTVDLADIAARAIAVLRAQFEAAGLELDTRLEPAPARGDPHRLHQVVTNLLTNAMKFTSAGGRIRVETHRDNTGTHLVVSDTGIGIPSEELPRIFDRFWRGAEAQAVAGSGIGLTVVHELIRAHRGTVAVNSEPGQGTEINITLPTLSA